MEDETTNNRKKNELNFKEFLEENKQSSELTDESIFDETLKEIDQILFDLENKLKIDKNTLKNSDILPEVKTVISKIHTAKDELTREENNLISNKNLLKRIEDIEKNITNSNNPNLLINNSKKETIGEIEEHVIDNNLLSIKELHTFEKNIEKKKKTLFGFYGYLILIIVTFIAFYFALNVSKDLIIFRYPNLEPYINYFYEIIEILRITVLGLLGFIKGTV